MGKIDFQALQDSIYKLQESKSDVIKELDNLTREVDKIRGTSDTEANWAYLAEDLQRELASINIEHVFGFIDDLEEEINDLTYKEQRAVKKARSIVNPLLKNTPAYFDEAFPAAMSDYSIKKKDK